MQYMHNPNSLLEVEIGKKRLKYEELLKYQVSMKYLHLKREQNHTSTPINYDQSLLNDLKSISSSLNVFAAIIPILNPSSFC